MFDFEFGSIRSRSKVGFFTFEKNKINRLLRVTLVICSAKVTLANPQILFRSRNSTFEVEFLLKKAEFVLF